MSPRPYRIWEGREPLRWRCYKYPYRAHEAVLCLLYPSSTIGRTLEVVNGDSGRLLASYTRQVNGIAFRGAHHGNKVDRAAKNKVQKDNGREETSDDKVFHAYSSEPHSPRTR